MPLVKIIVPAFNVIDTLSETLTALLAQTCDDFEIIIVNDGSNDETAAIAKSFMDDVRVQLITQRNMGHSVARNTGITAARGSLIGFCDAGDLWVPEKLAMHVAHLRTAPRVGVSYAGSSFIDESSRSLRHSHRPKLTEIDVAHIFKRNPIGNGSSAVVRRSVFDEIAYRSSQNQTRDWFFDETYRQSENIECWLRIVLTTDWKFEGVTGLLTKVRVIPSAHSPAAERELSAWEMMVRKLTPMAPVFFARQTFVARAYQLRHLARCAISDLDARRACRLMSAALEQSKRPLIEEPMKTAMTMGAALMLRFGGAQAFQLLMTRRYTRP